MVLVLGKEYEEILEERHDGIFIEIQQMSMTLPEIEFLTFYADEILPLSDLFFLWS
jgi:hypothetical protein